MIDTGSVVRENRKLKKIVKRLVSKLKEITEERRVSFSKEHEFENKFSEDFDFLLKVARGEYAEHI